MMMRSALTQKDILVYHFDCIN